MDPIIIVSSVTALLGIACLMLPLASKLKVPYTVLLAVLGIVISVLAGASKGISLPAPLSDVLSGVRNSGLTGHVILYVFLPSLLFAAGLAVDVRRLMDDVWPVLILAIVAVVLCTLVVGLSLNWVFAIPPAVALLLGSVIATTDPAAVIAIFRDIGVPQRLQILVEGESLFNDAAAIGLFTLLLGIVAGTATPHVGFSALAIVIEFIGGLILGYISARLVCAVLHLVAEYPVAEATLTLCLAYGVYILGDVYFHVSGVVATVTSALVIGSTGRTHLSAEGWSRLQTMWHQIDFVASTLIFVLTATMVPALLTELHGSHILMLAVVVAAALVARAAVLYGLMPALSAAALAQRVSPQHKAVILWGGLRGAVTLAMALSIVQNPLVPKEAAQLVATLATGFVLFTLFVNAPTLPPLIKLLGLNRLSPLEAALRQRTVALSDETVKVGLGTVAREFGLDDKDSSDTVVPGGERTHAGVASLDVLDGTDALKFALISLAAREAELYLRAYGDGSISGRVANHCIAQAGRLRDAAKGADVTEYQRVVDEVLRPTRSFRFALRLYNRYGVAGPLARILSDRFEVMLVMRATLKPLRDFTRRSIAPLFGEQTQAEIANLLNARHEGIDKAIKAFDLQYRKFAQSLRAVYVQRAALRLEESAYRQQRDEGLIGDGVYRTLIEELHRRRKLVELRPVLDLGLEITDMIKKVPLFSGMDTKQLKVIARLLQPRFAVPGEYLIRKGERGDAMFFIAAGEAEVFDTSTKTRFLRRSGEFVGEIALLYNTRRTAEVSARGYCHLLVLYARDLQRVLQSHPDLRTELERAAHARMAPSAEMDS